MNRYCVTIAKSDNKLLQNQIEVDAHSTSDALCMVNLVFGLDYTVLSVRAWRPQRYRPVTIWVRLKELFGGVI